METYDEKLQRLSQLLGYEAYIVREAVKFQIPFLFEGETHTQADRERFVDQLLSFHDILSRFK